ncbi:MAG: phosphoenolpyruvate--protein phosphotransferase, partial [Candidatus Omnitrophica bacterium]|nr:phosphoenolpyruvate--protein phosphotransferase [Candidatus Omnitrophota bacterium]
MLKGIPASPGIAMGKAYLFRTEDVTPVKRTVKDEELENEIRRLEESIEQTKKEICEIQDRISREMGTEHGDIFNAHILVLEDKPFMDEVIARLKREKIGVEWIFSDVLRQYIKKLSATEDEYFRERVVDVQDV